MSGPELRIKVASETGLAHTGDLAEVPPVTEAEKELNYRAYVAPRLNGFDLPCVEATTCFYTEASHSQFIVDRHPTVIRCNGRLGMFGARVQAQHGARRSNCR
jgi:hypothetical protein